MRARDAGRDAGQTKYSLIFTSVRYGTISLTPISPVSGLVSALLHPRGPEGLPIGLAQDLN
jgi:hypothetical protein